jgi:hypothetical protein
MTALRISKYNPAFRNVDGRYLRNEWTSVSDVGRSFDDGTLTLDSYIAMENAYVEAIRRFVEFSKTKSFKVSGLEVRSPSENPKELANETQAWLAEIQEGAEVSGDSLERLIRLILRESCWARLEGKNNSYIHFGYDYYMYAGTDLNSSNDGMLKFPEMVFCEEMKSPYIEDEE